MYSCGLWYSLNETYIVELEMVVVMVTGLADLGQAFTFLCSVQPTAGWRRHHHRYVNASLQIVRTLINVRAAARARRRRGQMSDLEKRTLPHRRQAVL